jgi:hypothetical protein
MDKKKEQEKDDIWVFHSGEDSSWDLLGCDTL